MRKMCTLAKGLKCTPSLFTFLQGIASFQLFLLKRLDLSLDRSVPLIFSQWLAVFEGLKVGRLPACPCACQVHHFVKRTRGVPFHPTGELLDGAPQPVVSCLVSPCLFFFFGPGRWCSTTSACTMQPPRRASSGALIRTPLALLEEASLRLDYCMCSSRITGTHGCEKPL